MKGEPTWSKQNAHYTAGLDQLLLEKLKRYIPSQYAREVMQTPLPADIGSHGVTSDSYIPPPIERDNSADTAKRMRLKKEASQLWKQMAHVKGAMSKVRPGKALMRLARQLIQLNGKRQKLWDEIDFFNKYGYLHTERKVTIENPANLEQQIKNQMSYRTKAQKMLERPLTLSQRQCKEARIVSINTEINRLKSLREGAPDVI